MSQTTDPTLELENQNTDDELNGVNDELTPDDTSNPDSNPSDSDTGQDESSKALEDEEKVTKEQLDAMSDEEFTQFVEEGKLPEPKPQVKVISKPEPKEKTEEPKEPEDKPTKEEPSKKDETPVDYKAVYEGIFRPFKANGKEITPRSVEDVIQLMQMGANYTKKLQVMQPLKKIAESVAKAEISQDDLNFLIDVHKGDKEAIKKLLSKHKVDPMDLDLETTNYVPKNNIVSDEDIEYSNVLDDIKDSIPKITEIMNKTWDSKSKEALLKDPNLMRALHEEIQMERFDKVQAQLEIEKTFGRYKGKSDVEAYIDLVTKLAKEQSNQQTPVTQHTKDKPLPTKPIPDKTKAAPIKSKATNQGSTITAKDIFSMSEEQFNKLSMRDLV